MTWLPNKHTLYKKEFSPLYVVLFLVLLFTSFYFINNYQERRDANMVLKNAAFTTGHFTGETEWKPRNWYYVFVYTVDGVKYYHYKPVHVYKDIQIQLDKRFPYASFPVIYDSLNPKIGDMLVFRYEFEELKLPFPSSLTWTDKFQ